MSVGIMYVCMVCMQHWNNVYVSWYNECMSLGIMYVCLRIMSAGL